MEPAYRIARYAGSLAPLTVIPAQAGIPNGPALGWCIFGKQPLDSRLRGNDGRGAQPPYQVIPSVAEEYEMPALDSISRFLDSSATLGMTSFNEVQDERKGMAEYPGGQQSVGTRPGTDKGAQV